MSNTRTSRRGWRPAAVLGAVLTLGALANVAHAGRSTGNPCKPNDTNGSQTIHGTDGRDHLCGGNLADTIYGYAGNDRLAGNHGQDRIYGGGGDDRIWPGKGPDVVNCGPGTDTVLANFETGHDAEYVNCEQFIDPA